MRPSTAALLALAVTLPLAGCGGGDSPGPASGTHLDQALSVIPADATNVEFGDTDRWRDRHKLSSADVETIGRRADGSAVLVGNLWRTPDPGLGWTAADTEWSATYAGGNGVTSLYRLRDAVDMAKVTDGLKKAGYQDKGDGLYAADPSAANGSGVTSYLGSDVRVDTGRHLVVATLAHAPDAVPDKDKSLATDKDVTAVTKGIGDVDYLSLALGSDACTVPQNLTPAAAKQAGIDDLGQVQAVATVMTSDTDGVAQATYASKSDAGADLAPRRKALSGNSIKATRPFSQLGTFTVQQHDAMLAYSLKVKQQSTVAQMVQAGDAPWAWCSPS